MRFCINCGKRIKGKRTWCEPCLMEKLTKEKKVATILNLKNMIQETKTEEAPEEDDDESSDDEE